MVISINFLECVFDFVKDSFCYVQCYFVDKYFEEIFQDTGKYCFGVEDLMVVLEVGVVETLIVWENLDIIRYILFNQRVESKGKLNL